MTLKREHIFDLIVRSTREVLPQLAEHDFGPRDRLEDLGASSVDRAEILMLVLEALSLRIARVETVGSNNLGELADLLHDKLHT